MNILETLNFSDAKPATQSIYKSAQTNYMAIGLQQGQLLAKHKTKIPTILTVLKGSIQFFVNDEVILLKEYDTFEIPVSVEHEVKGMEKENVFTLMQEK